MPAAEWYKNQKDRLKRALRAQKQSSASLPDLSNTPLQPNPAPHWQSGINPTDKGPEDTLRPLSSVIALNDSSTVVPTLQSPRNPAIATSVKPLPDLVVAHKDSPTAKKTTAAALGPPLNELQKVETQSKSNWSGLKTLLHTLSSGALTGGFGPLELAIGGLDRCIGIFEQASRSRDDFCELGEKLNQLLGDLAQFNDAWVGSAMTASVKNLCSGIEAELRIVEQKQGRNAPERYIEATEDLDTILECYRRICGYVERLMLNANLNMWKILDEEITDKRMLQLSPSMSGAYNSWAADRTKRRQCTEGTRVAELEKLNDWVRDSSGSAIYWINGMAGTGKTTIAYTLCAQLQTTSRLAASFFCTQLIPECRNIQLIIPAIAYQFAQFSYPFRHELSKVLGSDQVAHTRELQVQLETLIAGPLKAVQHALPSRLVVVIDALDECEDADSIGKILELLVTSGYDLPIRFIVSSRPEPEIYRRMMPRVGDRSDAKLVLHEINPNEVQHDIEAYLRQELRDILLTSDQWNSLVKRCGVLFIYASTACRYIKNGDEMMGYEEALEMVLGLSMEDTPDVEKELDKLYTTILGAAFNKPQMSEVNRRRMKAVLDTVICATGLMTTETLAGLLGLKNAEHASTLLRPLSSVVNVTADTASTLHASFPDFMLSISRSGEFYCSATNHNATLAHACLQQIRTNPVQFNVCGIESSYLFDSETHDMPKRVQRVLPSALIYACENWIYHLTEGIYSAGLVEPVFDFFSSRLLLWMEVMNAMKCPTITLMQMKTWSRAYMPKEAIELVDDACEFVNTYYFEGPGRSTPHIYISMLSFWPNNSPIGQYYLPRTSGLPRPHGTAIARRHLPLLATWYIGNPALAISSYPTGSRIAIAAGNNICVLDGLTGETLLGPFQGHTDLVTCVSVSSNGLYIASGSNDSTIRVWNANTGGLVAGPWKAHSEKVTSVSFSPDNTRIVSTGGSEEIRIWSVEDGELVVSTRSEHSDRICTAIFSAGGLKVISGNDSNTICFWDAHAGGLVSKHIREPSTLISSLALSANGSQFVSASSDGSICIWDTQARQLDQLLGSRSILTPSFDGEVTQAIFSPDNKYIASCDCSAILLWEAGSRKLVTVMVDQRMEPVTSISFSPDSSRLLSCTRKGTVYVWSISIRPPDVDHYVIRRKAERVHCACFSSDGSQIVTGTHNGSVWLWDVDSGKLAMSPLTGHEGRICSVAISSDGAYVASASSDKTIRLWDIKEAKGSYKVLEKHTKRQDILMFTSDNQQLLYGPLVYQVATSPFTLELETGSESALHHGRDEWGGEVSGYNKCCIASSPDGLYVASGSAEGTIRMWRAQTSQVLMGPIWGHSNFVSRILFSPNREHMVSFSLDDVMCFWPIPSESSRKDTSPHALGPDKQTGNPTSLSPHRKFNKSGWIVNDQDEHLIWVPRDLQPYLLRPGADQLISHRGSFEVDFTGANIGELWTRCYRPG